MQKPISTLYSDLVKDTLTYLKGVGGVKKQKRPIPQSPARLLKKKALPPTPPAPPTPSPIAQKQTFLPPPKKTVKQQTKPLGSSFLKTLKTILPHFQFYDEAPDDREAIRIKNAWRVLEETPDVPLLTLATSKHASFFRHLSKAIDVSLASSHLIPLETLETQKKWDIFLSNPKLKLILIPSKLLDRCPNLKTYLKILPKQEVLGSTPVVRLEEASVYLENVQAKRALWNTLCHHLLS